MRAREKPDRQVSRGCEMETDNEGQRREQEIKVVSELHGGEKKDLLRDIGDKGERKGLPVAIGTLR